MRGRKPKSVEERQREGNNSHTNVAHKPVPDVVHVGGRPAVIEFADPPESLDPDAAEFWTESVHQLAIAGVVDRVDRPALELLCQQYARARQARRVIAQQGLFSMGPKGAIKEHPAVKMEREATAQFMRMAENFALTPIARARLGLANLAGRSLAQELADGLPKRERVKAGTITVEV
jgi:P27 family predicted phage terminase small subunit